MTVSTCPCLCLLLYWGQRIQPLCSWYVSYCYDLLSFIHRAAQFSPFVILVFWNHSPLCKVYSGRTQLHLN